MQSLLSDAVNDEFEVITAKFGQMIRVKPKDTGTPQRPADRNNPENLAVRVCCSLSV